MSYDEIVALRSGIYFLNPNGSVDDAFIVLDEDHDNLIDKEAALALSMKFKPNKTKAMGFQTSLLLLHPYYRRYFDPIIIMK